MADPLVSIIVPAHNRAHTLARAVDSVLRQTYENLEVIVVDDCSIDSTAELISSYNDQRVRYHRNAVNLRGGQSRNVGVTLSKGDLIAFLDSDDEWLPTKLDEQVRLFVSCGSSACVIYSPVWIKGGAPARVAPSRSKLPEESVADYLFISNGLMQTSTLLMHRALFASVKFSATLKKHQDWDLCIRLEAAGAEFLMTNSPTAIWWHDEGDARVSMVPDPQFSLKWVETLPVISKRARAAFLVKIAAPDLLAGSLDAKLTGLRITINAFLLGLAPFSYLCRSVLKAIIPANVLPAARRWVKTK